MCVDTAGKLDEIVRMKVFDFVSAWLAKREITYVPESNEYEKGMPNERELEVSSMGILSVPLNDKAQPELLG